MYRVMVVMILLFAVIGCYAVNDVSDPSSENLEPTVSQLSVPSESNELSQLITYQAKHKAIKNILSDLSSLTGVAFKAGCNSQDWQVRDRKMNIYVKEIPLSNLMNSICRVMKFKWSKGGTTDHPYYRLYLDRKTLLGTDAKAYQIEQRFNEEVLRKRENFIKDILATGENLSPSQVEQLKKDNPYLYGMYERGSIAFLKALFKDVPETAQAIADCDRNMFFSASQLSPETQQLMIKAVRAKWNLKGYKWTSNGEEFPEDAAANIGESTNLAMETVPREFSSWGNDRLQQMYDYGGIGVYLDGRFCHIDFFRDPSSPVTQYGASAEQAALDGDRTIGDVYNETASVCEQAYQQQQKEFETYSFEEPVVDHPDEPWLHKKVKLDLKQTSLADIECALAQASEMNVVSDSFKSVQGSVSIGKGEYELKELLEKVSSGLRYDWEKHSNTIEWRSREWFKKRAGQIPDEWVDTWRTSFKRRGYLDIDKYAQIALLNTEQINENIATDEVFRQSALFPFELSEKRDLLRLYGHLNSDQKKALFSDSGLDLTLVTPEQWQIVCKKFRFDQEILNNPDVRVLLFCKNVDDKCYNFQVRTNDDSYKDEWCLPLPIYPEIKTEDPSNSKTTSKSDTEPPKDTSNSTATANSTAESTNTIEDPRQPKPNNGSITPSKPSTLSNGEQINLTEGQIELSGIIKSIGSDGKSITLIVDKIRRPKQLSQALNPPRLKTVLTNHMPGKASPGRRLLVVGANSGVGKPLHALNIIIN